MPFNWVTRQKNASFRIFYAKWYILLLVDGSTNGRNEDMFGDIVVIFFFIVVSL